MIDEQISDILKKYSYQWELDAITSVHWKAQEADSQSLLFYKVNDEANKEEMTRCKKHLEEASFLYCLVNTKQALGISNVCEVSSEDFYLLQECFLNRLYPINNEIKFLGVTGTNGKTTVVDIIRQLLVQENKGILTFGTLGTYLNDEKLKDFGLTTPSYIDLRKVIYANQSQLDFVAMELSSHALAQNRMGSIRFDQIGWTNLTQDHLDYHQTMQSYYEAKLKVFEVLKNKENKVFLPSTQKELGEKIGEAKIQYTSYKEALKNPFFKVAHNRDNLAVAKAMLEEYFAISKEIIEKINSPEGRFNIVPFKDSFIIIDFAHTPDAIRKICETVRNSFTEYQLITVFGCGGDRDQTKRPLMAEAACAFSDYVVLTSDNPRFEDPMKIIEDAKAGLSNSYEIQVDRKEAIKNAFIKMNKSVLLIVGKGHENYMDIKGEKVPYNDKEYVMELVNDKS